MPNLLQENLYAQKETKRINEKLGEVKYHLSKCFIESWMFYAGIIKNNKNPEFTQQILKKQELLEKLKNVVYVENARNCKNGKSYLAARDLIRTT